MSVEQAVTTDPRVLPRSVALPVFTGRPCENAAKKRICRIRGRRGLVLRGGQKESQDLGGGLRRAGVKQGDHVAVWMFDSKEAILTFFAINYPRRCICSSIPLKGQVLSHVLDVSDATVMVAHGQLLERLDAVETAQIAKVIHLRRQHGRNRL
ncbi:MAG: hypothetical protein CM15mP125_4270 [Gammaproteobacteria bacterium]|nr:MAG: hypothetical protein CM15mP125_4270 [Gammaproteobacteria bacterium]